MRRRVAPMLASAIQRHIPEGGDERHLEFSVHAPNDLIGLFPRHGLPIGSMLDQCREDIGNSQYPNNVGYAGGTKRIGISAAIEKFVMMADGIEDLRGDAGGFL